MRNAAITNNTNLCVFFTVSCFMGLRLHFFVSFPYFDFFTANNLSNCDQTAVAYFPLVVRLFSVNGTVPAKGRRSSTPPNGMGSKRHCSLFADGSLLCYRTKPLTEV